MNWTIMEYLHHSFFFQILELCKITEGNSISCQQFLSALKLIACVQAGYTLHPDLLTSSLEVPLPRFSNAADDPWPARDDSPDLIQLSDATNTYSTQLQDCSESTDNETSITLRANGVSSGINFCFLLLFFWWEICSFHIIPRQIYLGQLLRLFSRPTSLQP